MKTSISKIPVVVLASVLVVSCGGGGGGNNRTATGKLTLKVTWPKKTKVIPIASRSIKAVLTSGSTQLASKLIVGADGAPSSPQIVIFDNLSPGTATLTATAFPGADGSGVAQATGAVPVSIIGGQTTAVDVTMDSTIDHIDITPANPTVNVGSQVLLTATAKDINNAVVLTLGSYTWMSAKTTVATFPNVTTAQINATGVNAGNSVVTATLSQAEGARAAARLLQ